MKLSQYNLSILALGQEYNCFLYGTRNKKRSRLTCIPFLHRKGSLLSSFTEMFSREWLEFTQNVLKTNLNLPSGFRLLLKHHVVLASFAS